MSRNKNKIIEALKARGFTGNFELYYWNNDGWYCDCDQMKHDWIGFNTPDVLREIEKGKYDKWLHEC